MSQPLVTIGILSYNRPLELQYAITSARTQSYSNLEIIISDNGSDNDETRKVILENAAADNRIRYFLHERNRGPMFNFNFLVEQASGQYFIWLADDDGFAHDYIESCIRYFREYPATVLTANAPYNLETGEIIAFKHLPVTIGLSSVEKYTLVLNYIFNDLNLFYYGLIKMEALRKCKEYRRKIFTSDILLLPELLNSGDFYINPHVRGFEYRIHAAQTSMNLQRYKQITTIDATFFEKRFFFSTFICSLIKIIFRSEILKISEKPGILFKTISWYIKSKKYHLIKYDIGLNSTIQKIKGFFKSR